MSQDSPRRPEFGNEPPLLADRRRRPDRRQVSVRWLAGTLLTGLTSSALMGIALSAALDGRHTMASPAAAATAAASLDATSEKGERVFATAIPMTKSRQTLELSTVTREGDREVIRTLPFAYVNMSLAARHTTNVDYPAFDAMKVFAEDGDAAPEVEADAAQIYGGKTESEMSLKMEPFDFADLDESGEIDDQQAEAQVRGIAPTLSYDPVKVASLEPVDPLRFALESDAQDYEPGSAFRVIEENVSIAAPNAPAEIPLYNEEIIPFSTQKTILSALTEAGYEENEASYPAERLADVLSTKVLNADNVIRVGAETEGGVRRIVRLSVYRGDTHIVTVAENDAGRFEPAAAPDVSHSVADAFDENTSEGQRADMPSVYDGIYQAALSYGLNERLCQQLIRMLASEVDFQARLGPKDHLTVFYSLEEGQESATDASEILFVEADFGDVAKKYYRFRAEGDDHSDYYDEEGRSSRQFLLRKPVPNARMSSPFSTGRKHPVLGYTRPHWGVDWAAPQGTPILAAGSGVVETAGWTNGYGRQTILKHANGYETSYSHQSGIAKGVVPGARVRQGQIIGYIGSTGLSTGNHLHYEVMVNTTKLDPMRIKLPSGRVLQGEELEVFKRERDRIDNLLMDRDDAAKVAAR
ncbi:MAG: M23 family metallopeptidase [Hyphomicrobiales bacterium]|nr:MAG: M23 family metallopeptidase [Hyphomicrobiales bacterium]